MTERQLSAATVLMMVAGIDVVQVLLTDLFAMLSPDLTAQAGSQVILTVIYLALVWGVWRRSGGARWVLVGLDLLSIMLLAGFSIGLAGLVAGELAFDLLSLGLLFHPSVRAHLKAGAATEPVSR